LEEQGKGIVMSELMLEAQGPNGLFAIFSEDEGAGYFYVYKPEFQEVLAQIRIYESQQKLVIQESDVDVMWSEDYKKCGVAIWGKMRGIIELANNRETSLPLDSYDTLGITDLGLLEGFNKYLDVTKFIRSRQRYWQGIVEKHEPNALPTPEEQMPIKTNFVRNARGPDFRFAVFEDDGETGYLYLYTSQENSILRHLHIYDRSSELTVAKEDVEVVWSETYDKCGIAIWGKMRGIIDITTGQEGRVWLQNRQTPGIEDVGWLSGF
jgi:hypothetical protein